MSELQLFAFYYNNVKDLIKILQNKVKLYLLLVPKTNFQIL